MVYIIKGLVDISSHLDFYWVYIQYQHHLQWTLCHYIYYLTLLASWWWLPPCLGIIPHAVMKESMLWRQSDILLSNTVLWHFACMLQVLLYFLPRNFIRLVVVDQMNEHLLSKGLLWGEFLKYIAIWFLMSMVSNRCARWYNWEESEPNKWPFWFCKYMWYTRFKNITKVLCYTSTPQPTFVDKFYKVRDIIKAWNDNMKEKFIPSWMSCLDESMLAWTWK